MSKVGGTIDSSVVADPLNTSSTISFRLTAAASARRMFTSSQGLAVTLMTRYLMPEPFPSISLKPGRALKKLFSSGSSARNATSTSRFSNASFRAEDRSKIRIRIRFAFGFVPQ